MVCAVTEGEDKPLKYPLMFRTCELVVINKIDLLEHLDFDLDRFLYNLDAVNPGVRRMLVSARTGQGVDEFRAWLAELPARAADDVHSVSDSETRWTSNGEVGARA
jgi:hydrogenase nickel incorporation protein HypB